MILADTEVDVFALLQESFLIKSLHTEVWICFYLTMSHTHTFNCKQEHI